MTTPETPQVEIYQIHAFSDVIHGGNPAGVCLLDRWPADEVLSRIAQEVGPAVTAFVLPAANGRYPLRWFTRGGLEVHNFCGHATFSAAHVLLRLKTGSTGPLSFGTVTGIRTIGISDQYLYMTVPSWWAAECVCPEFLWRSVGCAPAKCFRGPRDYLLLFDSEAEVRRLSPDYELMGRELGHAGVIATAQRSATEVVQRFFCPGFSIAENEDPATGSAMSTLGPYWSARLGVSQFRATQLSARGGFFVCSQEAGIITIRSNCVTFLSGTLHC